MNLRAGFPPMPTPFKDGGIDPVAIHGNVRAWIGAGLGGVVALGTNGEASLLDDDEGDRVVEAGGAPRPPLAPLASDGIERIRTLLHETHLC